MLASMIGTVHGVNSQVIKMPMSMQPTQASFSHLHLTCVEVIIIKIKCGMKLGFIIPGCGKNTVGYKDMVMDMWVEITAKPVDKNNCKTTAPNLDPDGASGLRCLIVVSTARRETPA